MFEARRTRAGRAHVRTGDASVSKTIVLLLMKGLSTRRWSKADLARWAHVGEQRDDDAGVLMGAATQAACAGPPAARAGEARVIALDSMTQSPKHQQGKRACGSGAQRRWRCGGAVRMPPSGGTAAAAAAALRESEGVGARWHRTSFFGISRLARNEF